MTKKILVDNLDKTIYGPVSSECSSCRMDNVRYNFVIEIAFSDGSGISQVQWIAKTMHKILSHIGDIPHIDQWSYNPPSKKTKKNNNNKNTGKTKIPSIKKFQLEQPHFYWFLITLSKETQLFWPSLQRVDVRILLPGVSVTQ